MPVTLDLTPTGDVSLLEDAVNTAIQGRDAMARRQDGQVMVNVAPQEKMPLLQALLPSGEVADLSIHQPSLEDLYVHFIGAGGLAHRGGAE